jgi:L,D-transpeptidase catalytic domain
MGAPDDDLEKAGPDGKKEEREARDDDAGRSHEVDNKFELRDVPWVEYFEAGYAIHAAPWHDEYGKPRSHGCINLSPIDARRVFHVDRFAAAGGLAWCVCERVHRGWNAGERAPLIGRLPGARTRLT